MAKDLRHINVVDIESTCWDGDPPPGQQSEIIEIGIAVLELGSNSPKIVEWESIIVLPETSRVSEFCEKLTTLTPEHVAKRGIPFEDALESMKHYKALDRTWASWGDYDRVQFERQCSRSRMKYPFGRTHINLKNLFAIQTGITKEVGLPKAFEILGSKGYDITMQGIHHRGVDDAKNIARIGSILLRNSV